LTIRRYVGYERIGGGAIVAQYARRVGLVGLRQPAVADHIGREDCGEAAVRPIPTAWAFSLVRQSYAEGRRDARPANDAFPPDAVVCKNQYFRQTRRVC
jgi:hypothetical protein